MSNFTKKEIRATFLKLLEEKPLSKITVKNLVESCGINRNTFYYYYRDIYDLIDDIFNTEADIVLNQNPIHGHWHEGCLQSMHYLVGHSMVIHNVFNSISHEAIKAYLRKYAHNLIRVFCDKIANDGFVPESDKEFISRFYAHAFVGTFLDWIRGGMKQEPEEIIGMMVRLLNGSIYDVLRSESPSANEDKFV